MSILMLTCYNSLQQKLEPVSTLGYLPLGQGFGGVSLEGLRPTLAASPWTQEADFSTRIYLAVTPE